jgi:hypothetical protein
MTGGALLGCDDARGFLIGIHREHFGWAEIHADVAAFAPFGVDDHLTAGSFFRGRGDWDGGFGLRDDFGHEVLFIKQRWRELDFIQFPMEL